MGATTVTGAWARRMAAMLVMGVLPLVGWTQAIPPRVTTQTLNQTVNPGVTAGFGVVTTGTLPMTYRWQKNTVNMNNGGRISGATSETLIITGAIQADEGSYRCNITNTGGTTQSLAATLTVNDPPAITAQPTARTVNPNAVTTFSVTATGTAPLLYQWRKDGVDVADGGTISGAQTRMIRIGSTQQIHEGLYSCRVANMVTSVVSNTARLIVRDPPVFLTQPAPLTVVNPGDTFKLNVVTTGTPTITYRWRKNGVNMNDGGRISGVMTTTLTVTGAVWGDSANYLCRATNATGTVSSAVGRVIVNPTLAVRSAHGAPTPPVGNAVYTSGTQIVANSGPPEVDTTGTTQWACSGWTGAGSVPAAGILNQVTFNIARDTTLTWQWALQYQINTTVTAGGRVTLVQGGADAGGTWHNAGALVGIVAVPNPGYGFLGYEGDLTTRTAAVSLTMDRPKWLQGNFGQLPGFLVHPLSQNVNVGVTATFTVQTTGSQPIALQWTKNGTALTTSGRILSVTSTTLAIAGIVQGDEGVYRCVATNGVGSQTSNPALLSVNDPPSIYGQPVSRTVNPGALVQFNVNANGTAPIAYEWRKDGVALSNDARISGVDTSQITISGVRESDQGIYLCELTNVADSVETNPATLTVNDPVLIVEEPADQWVDPGATATLSVKTTGTLPIAWQWRKNGVNLAENPPRITGTTSATLTIQQAGFADAGYYDCLMNNITGPKASRRARLTVNPSLIVASAHGTPSPPVGLHFITSGTMVNASVGGSPELDTTGTTRWMGAGWLGGGSAPATGTTTQTQFLIGEDSTLQWLWQVQYRLDADALPPEGGWIAQRDGATSATGTWYNARRTIYVRPHPNKGWVFGGWGGDAAASGMGTSATLMMDRPLRITARFYKLPVVLRQPVGQSIDSGTVATIDVACTGSVPLSYAWLKDGAPLQEGGRLSGTASATLRISGFTTGDVGAYQCRVSNPGGEVLSKAAQLGINYRLDVTAERGVASPPQGTSYFPAGSQFTLIMTPTVIVEPSGKTRHLCAGWTGQGAIPATGTENRVLVTLDRDSAIQWNWTTQHLWETTSNPVEGGSISPPGGWIDEGTVLHPRPLAAREFDFVRWSGDLSGTDPAPSLTMSGPKAATAAFKPGVGTVRITVMPPTAGWTLTDSGGQAHQGSGSAVLEGVPCGQVTLAWQTPANCLAPAVNPVIRWLTSEADLAFVQIFTASAPRSQNLHDRILAYLLGVSTNAAGLDLNGDGEVNAADLAKAVSLLPASAPAGPTPADGATDVFPGTVLNWDDSVRAQSYKVSLWPDGQARPAAPTARDLTTSRYHPLTPLKAGTRYLWQVIAVNDNQPTDGPVWSFTTRP